MSNNLYIFANPENEKYIMVGCSENVDAALKRVNEFDFRPFDFKIYMTYPCGKSVSDSTTHSLINKWFPNTKPVDMVINGKTTHFYSISREDALEMIIQIAKINDAEELIQMNPSFKKQEVEREEFYLHEIESRFRFSECNIPIGATIEYKYDRKIKATVYDDTHILYNGEITTVTALARSLSKKEEKNGPRVFLYKNKTLMSIRKDVRGSNEQIG